MISLTGRSLLWIIAIPSLLIACLLGTYVAKENYFPLYALCSAVILGTVYFSFGRKLWMLIPIGLAIPFSANFLPFNFNYSELITGLACMLFFFQYQAMEKRGLNFGPAYIWIPFFGVVAILLAHLFSGGFGFRVLGSSDFGARKYLPAFFGAAAYVLILTAPNKDWKSLNRIPLYFFLASITGIIPSLLTTAFPVLTPIIFRLFGTANISAYNISIGESSATQLVRYSEFATFGISLFLFLVAYHPILTWWRPSRWWVLLLAFVAVLAVFYSGFRSNVFNLVVVAVIASSLSIGFFRTLVMCVPALVFLVVVAAGNNTLYTLPYTIQRTLSILPGSWNPDVIDDRGSSDAFRTDVQEIYLEKYFELYAFGNGFKFDPNVADSSMTGPYTPSTETFVIKKDFHVGWISLYDGVGIVGCIFIAWLMISMLLICIKLSRFKQYRNSPIFIWLTSYLVSILVSFFIVFGSLPQLMSQLGIFSAILLSLLPSFNRELRSDKTFGVLLSTSKKNPFAAPLPGEIPAYPLDDNASRLTRS